MYIYVTTITKFVVLSSEVEVPNIRKCLDFGHSCIENGQ